MADNTSLRGSADRTRINIYEQHELAYWSHELGVSRDQLRDTVERVGVMAEDVRKALGR